MPEIDQRCGSDSGNADRPPRVVRSLATRRTALTAWTLTAVFGLASAGTAVEGTSPPDPAVTRLADSTPIVGDLAPLGPFGLGPAPLMGTVTAPSIPGAGLKTVTAPSVPTATIAPRPFGTGGAVGGAGTAGAAGALGTAGTAVVPGPAGVAVPGAPAPALGQATFTTAVPDNRASVAIRTALAQLGLPYVWGGDGPTHGDAGFDCSGLTSYAYGTAGVLLPRTAATQYNAGPHVPAGDPLQPGDLLFYGSPARVHHVGMYLGDGRMVNAPTFGRPVQVAFYRYVGDDYLGATRPAASGPLTTGLLPQAVPVPIPDVTFPSTQQAQVFPAPTASLPPVLPQPGDPTLPPEQQSAARAIAEGGGGAAVTPARAVIPEAMTAGATPAPQDGGSSVAGTSVAGGSASGSTVAGSGRGTTVTSTSGPTTAGPTTAGPTTAGPTTAPTDPSGASTSTPSGTGSPAGTSTSASTTTSSPSAPGETAGSAPATSTVLGVPSSTPTTTTAVPTSGAPAPSTPDKAAGSSPATTTLLPTSMTPTSKPVATKTAKATVTSAPTRTAPPTSKSVKLTTTPDKPAATKPDDDDDDPTSASKTASSTASAKKSSQTSKDKSSDDDSTSDSKSSSSDSDKSDSSKSDSKSGSSDSDKSDS